MPIRHYQVDEVLAVICQIHVLAQGADLAVEYLISSKIETESKLDKLSFHIKITPARNEITLFLPAPPQC